MNMSKRVKTCFVRGCVSNSEGFPDKVFVTVPQSENRRRPWFEAARKPFIASKTTIFCCEDHFAVPEDFENYMRYKIMGGQILMKKHVVPHKFNWQTNITLDLTCKTDSVDQTEPEPKLRKISADNMPSASGSTSKQCNVGVQSSECEVCFSSFSQIIKIMDIAPEVKSEVLCDDYLKETQSSSSFEVCTRRENLHILGDVKYEVKEEFEQAGLETKILKNEIELVKEELQVPSEKNNDDVPLEPKKSNCALSTNLVLFRYGKSTKHEQHSTSLLENDDYLNRENQKFDLSKIINERRVECDTCDYRCILKSELKNHSVMHKNAGEVSLHKCDCSDYQSKYKNFLMEHTQRHSVARKKRFACASCDYRCVRKADLRIHSVMHKNMNNPLYKCDHCDYQSTCKRNLWSHSKRHLAVNERRFKCNSCQCRFNFKSELQKHSLVHKNADEVPLYKCDNCVYQSKYKENLLKHIKRHLIKNQQLVITDKRFKCDLCDYRCVAKSFLKKHNLVHKKLEEVPLYKCHNCDYQSKYKENLVTHSKQHSEKRFVCDLCAYQCVTKYKLKKHSLLHKHADEVPIYKCHNCAYQSKYKENLLKHIKKQHLAVNDKRFN